MVCFLVPGKGLEPLHLAAADFESAASTDSATPAREKALSTNTPTDGKPIRTDPMTWMQIHLPRCP